MYFVEKSTPKFEQCGTDNEEEGEEEKDEEKERRKSHSLKQVDVEPRTKIYAVVPLKTERVYRSLECERKDT